METRANYVLVGVFTLLVLAAAFGFVYWSAKVADTGNQINMIVRIEGSVTGLGQGSQVLFNGLKVGDVRQLRLDPNNPRVVIATTQVDGNIPITESTRATIGFQGLTGIAFIELKGGDVNEKNIIREAQQQGTVPVITADPSDVTDLLATAKDIAERANNILGQFEGMVGDVGPAVHVTADNIAKTSKNVEVFTSSLAANSGNIDNFLQSASRLADTANGVAQDLPDLFTSVRGVLDAVDQNAVRDTLQNVASITGTLRGQGDNIQAAIQDISTAARSVGGVGEAIQQNRPAIDRFLGNLGPISDTASQVATKLDTALGSASTVIAAIKPEEVASAIDNISKAAAGISGAAQSVGDQSEAIRTAIASASNAAGNIERITGTVAAKQDQIDQFMANLAPIGANVNEASAKLNQAVDGANRLIASVDPQKVSGAIDDVSSAAKGVSDVATSVGGQSEQIKGAIAAASNAAGNIERITGTVAAKQDDIDRFLASLTPLSANATEASAKLNQTIDNANKLITSVDSAKISATLDNVEGVTAALNQKREAIQSFIDNAGKAAGSLDTALTGLNGTRTRIDGILAGVNPDSVRTAIDNASAASTNIASAADSVARVANDIGNRQEDIDRIISNAQAATGSFNEASIKAGRVFDTANGFLQGADGKGLSEEATKTLESIRQTADSLRAQIAPIAANLQSFSGDGLKEVRGAVRSITQSVGRIERAVTDFSDNPSRLIYGGDEVKEFGGRTRR
ncbi:MlaD family protein [Mangrovibrevibacter kandeliae]|uniref:MlaD family protein n=1 Tax=Mangrovibrevibacter kandeliae TaxID=2968473 RepID=UPI0021184A07|nr:MlaD family protein [Aurantimonas sp. CSK15Z-1]MCQ8782794.1 MlaD family protein [Aurantimonas sp. CSK15Z-1]